MKTNEKAINKKNSSNLLKDFLISLLVISIGFLFVFALYAIPVLISHSSFNFGRFLNNMDAYYYADIVKNGYFSMPNPTADSNFLWTGTQNGMCAWPFFPMVCVFVKILQILTFNLIPVMILGNIFSFICLVLFLFVLIRFLRLKKVRINYFLIALLFVFTPVLKYFYSFYTEPLFMLLVITLMYFCEKKQFVSAGITGALLCATRVTGIFFILYLFYKIYMTVDIHTNNPLKTFFLRLWQIIKTPKYFFSLVVFPLGIVTFMLFLKYFYHLHLLAFVHIQVAWGRVSGIPLLTLLKKAIFPGYLGCFISSMFAICTIVFSVFVFFKRKKYVESIIIVLLIISSTISFPFSIERYIYGMLLFSIELYIMMQEDKINDLKRSRFLAPCMRLSNLTYSRILFISNCVFTIFIWFNIFILQNVIIY